MVKMKKALNNDDDDDKASSNKCMNKRKADQPRTEMMEIRSQN